MTKLSIIKTDEQQQLVYGWASIIEEDGKPVVDWQDHVIEEGELQKAAHRFNLNARVAKVMHNGQQAGDVVESVVFTKALQKALGVDLGKIGWLVVMKVHDKEVFKRVGHDLRAFSIGGTANIVDVMKVTTVAPVPGDDRDRVQPRKALLFPARITNWARQQLGV